MAEVCRVCGEAVNEGNSAICNGCGQRYHLRLRQDSPGKDCGEVWVNEDFLALEFGCSVCLGRSSASSLAEPEPGGEG